MGDHAAEGTYGKCALLCGSRVCSLTRRLASTLVIEALQRLLNCVTVYYDHQTRWTGCEVLMNRIRTTDMRFLLADGSALPLPHARSRLMRAAGTTGASATAP